MLFKLNSLSSRLLVSAALLISLFMALTGLSLNEAFKQSLRSAEREHLRTQMYLVLGAAALDGDRLILPEYLSAPQFNQLQSGLYAFVQHEDEVLWSSQSTQSLSLSYIQQLPALQPLGQEFFSEDEISNYFVFSYLVIWEEEERELSFQVTVLHVKNNYIEKLKHFQKTLWQWLAIATLMLLLLLLMLLRWGLSPLKQLAVDLKKIEDGSAPQLSGEYAKELQPVANNMNQLLKHEQEQRQRYSNTLGDLEHSLKTPLAVMQGELDRHESAVLNEQVLRMQDIVQHQLSRAVRGRASRGSVQVQACLQRILAALTKVYASKSISLDQQMEADTLFRGDERDLMEVLGNVLDNAFKHAQQHIRIGVSASKGDVVIVIEDDGEGIPAAQREQIVLRGQRLDTEQAGQGIGLAVVADIVDSYGGQLELHTSLLGGLKLYLRFKAA